MSEYITGLVSVVMPTYKRSEMLSRAIDSVLSQTYTNIELLLVNDNEPDDDYTRELQRRVVIYNSDSRFKLILQDKHVNGAVARNVGIRRAQGEYVAFLDDDDWWEPNKIEEQVKELSKLDESWGGVSCKFTQYDKNRNVIGKSEKYPDGYIYKDILYLLSDVATGTLLLRRNAFDTTRYFDEKLLRHQDLQLLVDFTSKYKLKEVDQYLHCVDVSDTQNRPDPEKIIRHKKAFFESVSPVIKEMTASEKHCIWALHRLEIGYVYLKNKDLIGGIKYILTIFTSPKAFGLSCKKILKKLREMTHR